ncbi:anti-sigma factor domain-containing protein [Geodermatophilus sp. URMC 63]
MSAAPGSHEPFDELAVGWALHALEPEDEAVFGAHLPQCPRCARTVAETSEVMSALASDLPPAEPSPDLRDRLRAAVERTEQLPPPAGAGPQDPTANPARAPLPAGPAVPAPPGPPGGRRRTDRPAPTGSTAYRSPAEEVGRSAWRRVLPNALVAAAVAAILALGTWNVVLGSARDEAQSAAAEQAEVMEALLQPGRATIAPVSDTDGHSVATVVARDGQVQVVTHGLRVNDRSDSTYVVWGVPEGDAAVALGTFDVVSARTDLRTVGSASTGLDDYETYAISIEPGRRAPSAPTDVVANGQVTS